VSLYDAISDLQFTIESVDLERRASDTSSGFERVTTTFHLRGDGAHGRGEDVTYDAASHDALYENPDESNSRPDPTADSTADDRQAVVDFSDDFVGEWTFAEFSAHLDDVDLFPTGGPEQDAGHHYRRWGVESAALDLALRANDTHLGAALGREREPVRFIASTRLGEPPSTSRVDAISDRVPGIGFKLDPTSDWTDEVIEGLPADRVLVVDFKGHYEGTTVDQEPDAELYERVIEAFPEAVIEDPAITDETEPVVMENRDRVSWDAPITGIESVRDLPFEPSWLNIKPSRFGTVESLFETVEYARERGMTLYGGGQFELGVGRTHIQLLASLLYPDAPNDIAPGLFNDPTVPERLPASPLAPSPAPQGLDL
jgi:hypothetical protein